MFMMKLKDKMLYRILITSACLTVLSIGCKKSVNNDNDNDSDNETDDIEHEISYDSVTDIDGNEYKTVTIGDQEWMAENLRVTRFNNGDTLTGYLDDSEWESTQIGAYAYWDKDSTMLEAYGMFYNWYAIDDSRNICPSGWHIPSDYEWESLKEYLIDSYDVITTKNVGDYLKSCRQDGSPLGDNCDTQEHPRWSGHDTHYGMDEFGFSALPGGMREADGNYEVVGYVGVFWSANEFTDKEALNSIFSYDEGDMLIGGKDYNTGLCVRCVKD